MPKLNRRRFLQISGAAGLIPAIPALPARAAAGGATSAQMLWASLYARAGNAQNINGLARAMGIPNSAARGIYAKLIETNVVAAHGATGLSRFSRPVPKTPPKPVRPTMKRAVNIDLEQLDLKEPSKETDIVETEVPKDDTIVETSEPKV